MLPISSMVLVSTLAQVALPAPLASTPWLRPLHVASPGQFASSTVRLTPTHPLRLRPGMGLGVSETETASPGGAQNVPETLAGEREAVHQARPSLTRGLLAQSHQAFAQQSASGSANGSAADTSGVAAEPQQNSADTASSDEAEPQLTPDEIREQALIRARRRLKDLHRSLGISTWGSLLFTEVIGTIAAINQPTLVGPGLCSGGVDQAIFGQFGCANMSWMHGLGAFATTSLYATTGIIALNMASISDLAGVHGTENPRKVAHRAMSYIHLAGMILQPVLGFLAFGGAALLQDPNNPRLGADFSAAMRTVHVGVGYVTLAALTTGMILEL